jgi:hypothetical protein
MADIKVLNIQCEGLDDNGYNIYHVLDNDRELDWFWGTPDITDDKVKELMGEWVERNFIDDEDYVSYSVTEFNKISEASWDITITLKSKCEKIVEEFDPEAIKFEADDDYASVLIKDKSSKWTVWVDVDLTDGSCEWNQYIFTLTDSRDVLAKNLQEQPEIYDVCSGIAVDYLYSKDLMKC